MDTGVYNFSDSRLDQKEGMSDYYSNVAQLHTSRSYPSLTGTLASPHQTPYHRNSEAIMAMDILSLEVGKNSLNYDDECIYFEQRWETLANVSFPSCPV